MLISFVNFVLSAADKIFFRFWSAVASAALFLVVSISASYRWTRNRGRSRHRPLRSRGSLTQ